MPLLFVRPATLAVAAILAAAPASAQTVTGYLGHLDGIAAIAAAASARAATHIERHLAGLPGIPDAGVVLASSATDGPSALAECPVSGAALATVRGVLRFEPTLVDDTAHVAVEVSLRRDGCPYRAAVVEGDIRRRQGTYVRADYVLTVTSYRPIR